MNTSGWFAHVWHALRPAGMGNLSPKSQTELLRMSFSRLRFSVSMMPMVAIPLVAYFGWSTKATPVLAWGLGYVVLAFLMYGVSRHYAQDQRTLSPEQFLQRWLPRVQAFAWLHGVGLALSVVAATPGASQEFNMLLYLVIAHIVATNATHQTPTIGVFLRFFASSWNVALLLMYWVFPDLWHIVVPLGLIFSLVIYRHALISHRFAIEQVRLKELSEQLAEQFRAAKEQAEAALQEKNLFLATASHDLRQPIHAMSMLVGAIALRNQQASLSPLLGDLKHSMGSLNQMFNSLLDLSKLEAGTIQQCPRSIVLPDLLREIAILFREQASQRGLDLRVHVSCGKATAWADYIVMRQAIVNLVHNALRYTQRGGILLALRKRANHWQIEVWDTGIGIAAEDKERIFSPFYRPEHAWHIDSAGHGLGLAVVARCARLMGATLGFQSRMGRGSRFWLSVSAHAPSVVPARTLAPPATMPLAQCVRASCLVVDDDPQVIEAWRALLDSWGLQGRYAENAAQAIAHLDAGFLPDAIFCDQRLRSGESGFDILQVLLERCPNASGAMVSGELSSPELHIAQEEGFLVLHKPLDTEQLRAVLTAWSAHPSSPPSSALNSPAESLPSTSEGSEASWSGRSLA